MQNENTTESPLLAKISWVASMLIVNKRTVQRMVADHELPRPFKVGRSTRWYKRDIEQYLEQKAAERG